MSSDIEQVKIDGIVRMCRKDCSKCDDHGCQIRSKPQTFAPGVIAIPPFDRSRNDKPADEMLCEGCGKKILFDEYAVNCGLCSKCMDQSLERDGLANHKEG